jgi:hypothetical protein
MSFVDTNVHAGAALSEPASPPLLLDPPSDPEASLPDPPPSDPEEPPLLDPLLDPEALESTPGAPPSEASAPPPFAEPPQAGSAPRSNAARASTTPVDERRGMVSVVRRGGDGASLAA